MNWWWYFALVFVLTAVVMGARSLLRRDGERGCMALWFLMWAGVFAGVAWFGDHFAVVPR